ncbi:TetR/AcrR family transcriptional regulator [Streptodolium elevatio]|uniref:TetR/AcrR family transcriptional regulator n=1 Tax=Streptodolium elevatio TaxID=3157996 RepID=A0ABV3DU90_9ACTN
MTEGADGTATRGRGRPARFSREQIIEAAVALVYADPGAPLTIKRVAEAVGSAPMALYRYFPDRDDLLHAVADRVATDMHFDPPEGATWQDKLRAWMLTSMEHLRPYPQLLPYIASTRQPAWLPSFIMLTSLLSPLGLDDEDMALAISLVGTTIVGQAILATQRAPADEMAPVMREALRDAAPEHRARVEPVIDRLPEAMERLYGLVIDNTIVALEGLGGVADATTGGAGRERRPKPAPLAPLFTSAGAW